MSAVLSSSFAVLVVSLICLIIGLLFNRIINKGTDVNNCGLIYCNTYAILLLFCLFRYLDLSLDPGLLAKGGLGDEQYFWEVCEEGKTKSFEFLFGNDLLTDYFWEDRLYYFFTRILASFAHRYLDGNNYLYQLIPSGAAFTSYIVIFIYSIITKRVGKVDSSAYYKFIFLSCLFPVALVFHRDCMIAFMYAWFLYLSLCKKQSIINTTIQVLIAFLTFFLREQHGLFLVLLICINFYLNTEKYRKLAILLIIVVGLSSITYIYMIFDNLVNTFEVYDAYAEELNTEAGLSSVVDRLPIGIKQFALVMQGQFYPIPLWAKIPEKFSIYYYGLGLIWAVISVYWFRVFAITSYGFFIKYKYLAYNIRVYYLVFIVFLVLNSTNADPRRMMCMYPICYLAYLSLKKIGFRQETLKFDNLFYKGIFILHIIILILKF